MEIREVPIASDASEARERHEINRKSWNEAAAAYTADVESTIAFLRSRQSNLHAVERANLGDLERWCARAIHLQCASGKDTLSLVNEGVKEVVGVDISEMMIDNARRTSAALGVPARWYCCDVLDTPAELDGWADLVYTGRGALCWIHEIARWAKTVARLLRPGGTVHVFDDHPLSFLFEPEGEDFVLIPGTRYFARSECVRGWPSSYIQDSSIGVPSQLVEKYIRVWTLSELFGALRGAGFTIEILGEHPDAYFDPFPNLKPALRGKIPMTFSILARLPPAT